MFKWLRKPQPNSLSPVPQAQLVRSEYLSRLASIYKQRTGQVFADNKVWGSEPEWVVAPRYLAMGIRLHNYSQVSLALGLTKAIGLATGHGDGTQDPPVIATFIQDKVVYQFPLPEWAGARQSTRLRLWVDIPVDYPYLNGGVGVGLYNTPVFYEFREDAPHARVTGTTGSGKTELMKTILYQLMHQNPVDTLRVAIVDPKGDFESFRDEVHLLWNPATDQAEAEMVIRHFYAEFARREEGNLRTETRYLLCIDEADQGFLADSTDNHERLNHIARRGRAFRMHLLIGTHEATKDSLGGLPANLSYRWHGRVPDAKRSGQVEGGLALHKLTGKGDFYHINGAEIKRFQGAIVLPAHYNLLQRSLPMPVPRSLPQVSPVLEIQERKPAHRPQIELDPEHIAYYLYHKPDNVTEAEARDMLQLKRVAHLKHKDFAQQVQRAYNALGPGQ